MHMVVAEVVVVDVGRFSFGRQLDQLGPLGLVAHFGRRGRVAVGEIERACAAVGRARMMPIRRLVQGHKIITVIGRRLLADY